jgi:hypothetical protein
VKYVVIILIVVLAFIIGGFWILAPALQKDKVVAIFTNKTNERQCFTANKVSLRDPDTAYLYDSTVYERDDYSSALFGYDTNLYNRYKDIIKDYDSAIVVTAKAKNAYGAYGDTSFLCVLSNGRFYKSTNDTFQFRIKVEDLIN